MHALKTNACAALLAMALAGCTSAPPVPPPDLCPPPPAPPAWLMQDAPNSQQTLDRIISPSEINSPKAGK